MIINYTWPENSMTKREIFKAANNKSVSLQKLDPDTIIDVQKFFTFIDEKQGKEPVEVLYIIDKSGAGYNTISESVKRIMIEFVETVDDAENDFRIQLIRGTTKAGRQFLSVNVL